MNNQINYTDQDSEHLKILSICHYILAGLCVFPLLYGLFYVVMGVVFGTMIANSPPSPNGPPPALFGGIFVGVGLFIAAVALVSGLLLLKAGRSLANRQSYMFCFVIACIACLFVPFGTVLGIFTIIVLARDSVKALFNEKDSHLPYDPPPNVR